MSHEEFVAGYAAGSLRVRVDRERAAKLVSARLLLPFVLLPVLGLAVALALTGYLVAGIGLFLATFALRHFIRASGQGFVLSRALQDPAFYEQVVVAGVLSVD